MSEVYFRQSKDSTIHISNGTKTLDTTLDVFLQLEPSYIFIDGAVNPALDYEWRQYEPGVYNRLYTSENAYDAPMPWENGDAYIAEIQNYLAIIDNPTQDLQIAKNIKIDSLNELRSSKLNTGGITLFSTTMPSNKGFSADVESYTRAGATPADYYQRDINEAEVALTLVQLQTYQDATVKMKLEHRKVYDDHYDAIQALEDIPSVEAYNITTGWPTLPFDPT
jgi:hypothetical protein